MCHLKKWDLSQGGKTEIDEGNTSGSLVCDDPGLMLPTTIHVILPTRTTTKCTVYLHQALDTMGTRISVGSRAYTASTYGNLLVHASHFLTSDINGCR